MAIQMQQRRGTAAQWTSVNPTLAAGEIGVETDTQKFKVGNGSTAWNSLGYTGTPADATSAANSANDALGYLGAMRALTAQFYI